MSVQRSPTGSGPGTERSSAYLELAKKNLSVDADLSDVTQVTIRNPKRKLTTENEEIRADFTELKAGFIEMRNQMTILQNQMSEMMACITSNNKTQIENFSKLCGDVTVIKDQVKNIKSTTERITEEHKVLKSDIASIKKFNKHTEKQIESLESNIQQMKLIPSTSCSPSLCIQEEIIVELNERSQRCKNIILYGIAEPDSKDTDERRAYDKSAVLDIIKTILDDCPIPEKIFRLGKYDSNKNRPLKVCFAIEESAKNILRNKNKCQKENVKIFSDQTPQQQAYRKLLKDDLERRTKEGETNLTIKYVRGIPKLIQATPKNSNQ